MYLTSNHYEKVEGGAVVRHVAVQELHVKPLYNVPLYNVTPLITLDRGMPL